MGGARVIARQIACNIRMVKKRYYRSNGNAMRYTNTITHHNMLPYVYSSAVYVNDDTIPYMVI